MIVTAAFNDRNNPTSILQIIFTRKLSEKKQIELIVQNAFEVGVIAVVVVDSAKYCVLGVVHCVS